MHSYSNENFPKKCLKCNKTQFVKQNVQFTPEMKGETIEVVAPCIVCKNCGLNFMNTEQMDFFRRKSNFLFEILSFLRKEIPEC